jgi:hypothetical protein
MSTNSVHFKCFKFYLYNINNFFIYLKHFSGTRVGHSAPLFCVWSCEAFRCALLIYFKFLPIHLAYIFRYFIQHCLAFFPNFRFHVFEVFGVCYRVIYLAISHLTHSARSHPYCFTAFAKTVKLKYRSQICFTGKGNLKLSCTKSSIFKQKGLLLYFGNSIKYIKITVFFS